MYVFTKPIEQNTLLLDYARSEAEREAFLNEYDGYNYSSWRPFPMTKGLNYDEKKIPKYRLRNIIHAANRFNKKREWYEMRIIPPHTPRQRRKYNRIPCPF